MSNIIPRGQTDITCDAEEYHISIHVKEKVAVSVFFDFDIIGHISFLWPRVTFDELRYQNDMAYVSFASYKGEHAKKLHFWV